jgi:tetratricopeptide (TPR) repeat protein
VQIGVVYAELGRWQAALETGRKLRQLLPDEEIGYWAMSSAFCELGRYSEAIDVTEANLRQNPSSLPPMEGLAYIFLKSGRFADAIPSYKRAIEAHPEADYLHARLPDVFCEKAATRKITRKVAPIR